jgi:single-strand DNA-binding protein
MLNRIFIMGRLARDPELRRTQTGTPVASFTLAVDRDFKDKSTGERTTDWIDVVAWRSTAEFVSRYFTKGRMAVVEGRLQIRDWTDKDGNKRRSAEVVADQVYFGDSKRDGEGASYSNSYAQGGCSQGGYAQSYAEPQAPSGYGAPPAGGDQFAELSDSDGELPF